VLAAGATGLISAKLSGRAKPGADTIADCRSVGPAVVTNCDNVAEFAAEALVGAVAFIGEKAVVGLAADKRVTEGVRPAAVDSLQLIARQAGAARRVRGVVAGCSDAGVDVGAAADGVAHVVVQAA